MIPGHAWAAIDVDPMPWPPRWFDWERLCVLAAERFGWLPTDTLRQPIGVLACLFDPPTLVEVTHGA